LHIWWFQYRHSKRISFCNRCNWTCILILYKLLLNILFIYCRLVNNHSKYWIWDIKHQFTTSNHLYKYRNWDILLYLRMLILFIERGNIFKTNISIRCNHKFRINHLIINYILNNYFSTLICNFILFWLHYSKPSFTCSIWYFFS
jgi:hypothetical protein